MVFERPARHERPEICEHFYDPGVGDMLGEVEPVRTEVCRHVGRA